jgi:hypothetical protein
LNIFISKKFKTYTEVTLFIDIILNSHTLLAWKPDIIMSCVVNYLRLNFEKKLCGDCIIIKRKTLLKKSKNHTIEILKGLFGSYITRILRISGGQKRPEKGR